MTDIMPPEQRHKCMAGVRIILWEITAFQMVM